MTDRQQQTQTSSIHHPLAFTDRCSKCGSETYRVKRKNMMFGSRWVTACCYATPVAVRTET